MSALALALSASANTSLIEATQATSSLRSPSADSSAYLSSDKRDFVDAMNQTIGAIKAEAKVWNEHYRLIDESGTPEAFFTDMNVKHLEDADIAVRGFEQILRIQSELLVEERGETLGDEVFATIRQVRIAVAKLRMAISNVLKIKDQLRPAIASNKSIFDMNNNALQSLKVATQNVYYH
ncbi:hypothetical protein [Salinivibrio sp. SS2]|uniref:hypothetical protein n=1 Tax=Salinivibrio sp. SS2 TaxID=1892894 RepID=UPI001113003F|nr:hypothetical protein [Salinivibrio sp. DV]